MKLDNLREKKIYIKYMLSASNLYKYSFDEQMQILSQKPNATLVADKSLWDRLNAIVDKRAKSIVVNKNGIKYNLYDVSDLISTGNTVKWEYDSKYTKDLTVLANRTYNIGTAFNSLDLIYSIADSIIVNDNKEIRQFVIESTSFIVLSRCGFDPLEIRKYRPQVSDLLNRIDNSQLEKAMNEINSYSRQMLDFITNGIRYINKTNEEGKNDKGRLSTVSGRERRSRQDNDRLRANENGIYGGKGTGAVSTVDRRSGDADLSTGVQTELGERKRNSAENNENSGTTRTDISTEGIPVGVRQSILEGEQLNIFKQNKEAEKSVSFFNLDLTIQDTKKEEYWVAIAGSGSQFIMTTSQEFTGLSESIDFKLFNLLIEKDNKLYKIYSGNTMEDNRKIDNLIQDSSEALTLSEHYYEGKCVYIEYNESGSEIGTYRGEILTNELLDKIIALDNTVQMRDEGYYKFFFDVVENGSVTEHNRCDIGDGNEINRDMYSYLRSILEAKEISETEEIAQEAQEEKIAVKSGYYFAIADRTALGLIDLDDAEQKVRVENEVYDLYRGTTYSDARKIDDYIDGNGIKTYSISKHSYDEYADIIGKTIISDNKKYKITDIVRDRIFLDEIIEDPMKKIILAGGSHVECFISDYEDQINKLKGIKKVAKKEKGIKKAEKEPEQIGFIIPMKQETIDKFLIYGGNQAGGRLPVIAEFSKGKSLEELSEYLKDTFTGGYGLYIDEKQVSCLYTDDGIMFANGNSANSNVAYSISWQEAAKRINELLDEGQYGTNIEVSEALSYEKRKIAESLRYLMSDMSDEGKSRGYFISLKTEGKTFPEAVDGIIELLGDNNFLDSLIKEYEIFLSEYKENNNILLFYRDKVESIYESLKELKLPRKEYKSNLTELPKLKPFITEDEILADLSRGGIFAGGKSRIYEYFTENHTIDEKAKFLKNEYGIGGHSHALSGAKRSDEMHGTNGIKYTKLAADPVELKWNEVAQKIDFLIEQNLMNSTKDVNVTTSDVEQDEILLNESPLEALKRTVVDYLNEEFDENYDYKEFDSLKDEKGFIGLAYTTTPDGEHDIQFVLDIDNLTTILSVDNTPITKENYLSKYENKDEAINKLTEYITYGDFGEFTYPNEEDLKNVLGYSIDDEGYFVEDVNDDIQVEENLYNADYTTDRIFKAEKLTPSERLFNNLEAIKLVNKLKTENRLATNDEQKVLSQYVGWGGLSDVFSVNAKGQYRKAQEVLKNMLNQQEYDLAYKSTTSSFYTPTEVINNIYKVIEHLGFKGGSVLEPSMGIGNFFALMPENLKSISTRTGVELDKISADISKYLYPNANIINKGFETAPLSDNSFDVVIGNVPFGTTAPFDSEYNDYKLSLHDYFVLKSIDKARPNGIVALITSSSTFASYKFLRFAAEKADLVGAFKLPNNVFKDFAGTTVDTDILIFKKREHKRTISELTELDWYSVNGYGTLTTNQYFSDNPQMIFGIQEQVKDQYGKQVYTVNPNTDMTLDSYFENALKSIPSDIYIPVENDIVENAFEDEIDEPYILYDESYEIQNYTFGLVDGEIYYREDDHLYSDRVPNKKAIGRIKGLISLRNALKELIHVQVNNFSDVDIANAQKNLLQQYNNFYNKYGRICDRGNKTAFADDTTYPLLESLEEIDDNNKFNGLADIFYKRTIVPFIEVNHVDTSVDALSVSMQNKACVDLSYMSELSGKSEATLIKDLEGLIYKKPSGDYVTKDEFISGNIRDKITDIEYKITSLNKDLIEFEFNLTDEEKQAIETDINTFTKELDILEKAMPEPLDASEIDIQIGARWIDTEYYEDFLKEIILKNSYYSYNKPEIFFSKELNKYEITKKSYYKNDIKTTELYGTDRMNAFNILENMLNMKTIQVKDKIIDGNNERYVINKSETLLAQQKATEINLEFKDWIFKEESRRKALVDKYNNKFNVIVPRKYDGEQINPVGINQAIKLKEHQKNAVARQLYSGRNTLLAHCVGAGKTFTMITAAMEKKRIGLANKSLFVVPKPLVEQWANEFQRLYPSAKVLVTRKNEFQKKKRKRFCSKIATGEYDAIIMSHEQFGMIPMSNEYLSKCISDDLARLKYSMEKSVESGANKYSVKKIASAIKSLEKKLKTMNDMTHDDVLTFEELGIDNLYVDEAHEYKNLFIDTGLSSVRGVQTGGNKKTQDMLYKTRYLNEKTGYTGITFATGTPVTNTLCELYSMMRYLQPDQLEEQNLEFFDSWVAQYGVIENTIDMSVDGSGYNIHQRFTKYKNTPELVNLWHTSADVIMSDDLDLNIPKANYHNIEVPLTELTESLIMDLSDRIDAIADNEVSREVDNMLKVTNDGRTIALDTRLIDESLVNEVTKSSMCADKVYELYTETADELGTQLIFCDQSVPSDSFNVYDEIKGLLVAKGIPADEIKYIHEADGNEKKLQALFETVKEGKVRVLIGSTRKMGQGMNVQDRLVALHHLDVPWRPADLEQREGRILRRGNQNTEVDIFRYVAKGTFDAYSWDKIIQKQKGIKQLLTSNTPARTMESFDSLTFEASTAKAIAINNPLIKEKAELDAETMKLEQLRNSYKKNLFNMQNELVNILPIKIKNTEEKIANLTDDAEFVSSQNFDDFEIKIKDKVYTDKKEAGAKILQIMAATRLDDTREIGEYKGFKIVLTEMPIFSNSLNRNVQLRRNSSIGIEFSKTELGNFVRMDNILNKIPDLLNSEKINLEKLQNRQKDIVGQIDLPFKYEDEYKTKKERLGQIELEINQQATSEVSPLETCKKKVKNYLRQENLMKLNYKNIQDMDRIILYDGNTSKGHLKVELCFSTLELKRYLNEQAVLVESYATTDELYVNLIESLSVERLTDIDNALLETQQQTSSSDEIVKSNDFELEM